jgi:hypothetical protein
MEFRIDHPIIFILVAIVICAVMAQAVFFMLRALKRAKELNIDKAVIKRTIISATIFTIAPAISIIIGIIALAKKLGIALPWLRLSVVGSLSYETVAAENAVTGITGNGLDALKTALTGSQFVTVTFVMTISIMLGVILTPLIGRRLQNDMISIGKKDPKWMDIFQNALFIGMISAFLGMVFADFGTVFKGETYGLVPILVFASAAVTMLICGLVQKITKWRFMTDYALPISMVVGMLMAIPLTMWLGTAPIVETVITKAII